MRKRAVGLVAALCSVGVLATAAEGHFYGFTGSVYQDIYVPYNSVRFLVNSTGGRLRHSFSFVSADDLANKAGLCARLYLDGDTANFYDSHCGVDFVRHCGPGQNHSLNQLDCHDQDFNQTNAAASNGTLGTTVRIHGSY